MKTQIRTISIALGLFCSATAFAQTAAPGVTSAESGGTIAPTTQPSNATPSPNGANTNTQAAAGGGGGKVWMNTQSKAYYCEGTSSYGRTPAGEYMSETDAKARGARGSACVK